MGSGGAGPWYVMQGGSITINAAWAASPSVGIATDAEGDSFSITSVGTATLGGSITNNSSNIVYTAGASSFGKETFSFTITDAKGGTLTTTMTIHVMTAYTWTGGGGTNTWSTVIKENWCGTINTNKNGCVGLTGVPGATVTAIIDNTCTGSYCSPTPNYNVSVQGLKIAGSQLNQGTGNTLTIGSSGFAQTAGIFSGGNSAISVGGAFSLTGGDFTSTSGTLTYTGNSFAITTASLFHHNNGSVSFTSTSTINSNSTDYYHVTFGGWYCTFTLSSPLTVNGTLTLADTYNGYSGGIKNSYINAKGDVTATNYGQGGTTVINIVGNSSQAITGGATTYFPSFSITSTGGTVSFTNTILFVGSFTYNSGTVDFGTSSVSFLGAGTVNANNLNFYNLTLGGSVNTITISNPINVNGTLTFTDANGGYVNGSHINAYGNITSTSYGKNGTTVINVVGNSNQTITGTSTSYFPSFNIASTGGTVTFANTFMSGYNFTYTSGVVDFGTSTVIFTSTQTVNANNLNFYNLTITGSVGTITLTNPISVYGDLAMSDVLPTGYLNGSSISVYGNVTTTSNGKRGTTNIYMLGSANSNLSCGASAAIPGSTFTIQKDVGYKVTQTAACSFASSGQNFTVQSGEHNMGGYNLTINNYLTVNTGAALTAAGGTYSPSSGAKYSCLGTCSP